MIRKLIIFFACLAVLLPCFIRILNTSWSLDSNLVAELFPLFGLLAFTVLWLHIVGAGLENWLVKYIDFNYFINSTSYVVLVAIILHPLLALFSFGFNLKNVFLSYGTLYITIGIIGWLLLITYDIGRAFKHKTFFVKHWNKILFVSTIGFLLTFFHSLNVGSDLQTGPLHYLWIFYGTTAILSTIYTYGIKTK